MLLAGQTGGPDIWGSFDLLMNGQGHCLFWIEMHPNGSADSANVALGDGYSANPTAETCDSNSATSGAVDMYPDASTAGVDVTNNSTITQSILIRTWAGPN
jgi:hypothetical protein